MQALRKLDGTKDSKTTTDSGEAIEPLPEGVSTKEVRTHVDDRGSLVELFDVRWAWSEKPLVFSYTTMVRPGAIKGWACHEFKEDRYFILYGDAELVLYDDRPKSSTYGLVSKVFLSETNRRLINIPPGIWHALRNIGTKEVAIINFPTECFDHQNPDKFRLPLDTDKIPYKFDNPRGG